MLPAVVDDLTRPEPAHAVRAAVEDIISEIVYEEAQDPRPPPALERDPDVEQVELIGPHRHADDRRDDRRPRDLADRTQHQRGQRVAHFVSALVAAERRSEEHTSELQSLMSNSYAVFCLKQKKQRKDNTTHNRLI